MALLEKLASPKLSALILLWLVLTLPPITRELLSPATAVTIGGVAFLINLLAFLWLSPFFRQRPGLLIFHAALAFFLILAALSRLTWLEGHAEIASGETFDGHPLQKSQGIFHPDTLNQLRFTNQGFTIDYAPGLKRGPTRNQVSWTDAHGSRLQAIIGDDTPLILNHYRFYTTANKGFAPLFTWQPKKGQPVTTPLHLPSYPLFEKQTNTWTLPEDGPQITATLNLEETILDETQKSQFRLPTRYSLTVAVDGQETTLRPGQEMPLPSGRLRLDGLTSWMGYRIHYDRTRPWLLATVLVATAGLAWHFRTKFHPPADQPPETTA
ncbi:MAG: hypothetical protein HQL91_13735 [Magnetococcales bacterium]|nr:hypothetical protein [Magnetococcales bacterium]